MLHSENKELFASILQGELPSKVFNSILEAHSELDKYELASLFMEEFHLLDSRVFHIIWNWKSIKSLRGTEDELFNFRLLTAMREFGYNITQ